MPCEDLLPSSSFCHVLGGDFFCSCAAAVAQNPCGTTKEIPGFGILNVSSECRRTCGGCASARPPLFHEPCPSGKQSGGSGGGSGAMHHSGGSGYMGGGSFDVSGSLAQCTLPMADMPREASSAGPSLVSSASSLAFACLSLISAPIALAPGT